MHFASPSEGVRRWMKARSLRAFVGRDCRAFCISEGKEMMKQLVAEAKEVGERANELLPALLLSAPPKPVYQGSASSGANNSK